MKVEQSGAQVLGGRIRRVALASAVAQALGEIIALGQTVVVARLLSPAEVGIFAAGTVLTAFLAEFSEGGLRSALVNREDDVEEAAETVFWATLISGLVLSLCALAAAPLIALIFDSSTAGLIAATSAGGLLLYSAANVPEAFLQREFSVQRRLIVGPAIAIAFAAVTITLAALGAGPWSLVAGTYASYLTLLVTVWLLCGWRPRRAQPSIQMWRTLARYGFPLITASIASKARQLAEALVVGRAVDTVALGQYRYGLRIARVPANALIEVVAYALFPAFSRIAGDGARLGAAYIRALSAVTICAAPVSGLMFAIGEPLVVIVLGEPWRGAGILVTAMAGLGLGKGFASVSEEAIKGSGRTSLINRFTAVEIVLGLGLLVMVIPFGLVGVGLAVSITALVVGIQCVVGAHGVLGTRAKDVMRATILPVTAAVLAAAGVALLERDVLNADDRPLPVALALLALEGLAFLVVYLGVLAIISPAALKQLYGALRRGNTPAPRARHRADGRPAGSAGPPLSGTEAAKGCSANRAQHRVRVTNDRGADTD
ncbi:oligosaccharide flippase family protein [Pseudonocardia sp. GCM10023141]|uniref:oligosaccharide flippase family protein n=1 Tax=Pseudonocardia sp. GCM10023141 TaxID=3252653 RepID=UPI0036068E10